MDEKPRKERTTVNSHKRLPLDVVAEQFAAITKGPNPLTIDGRRIPGLPNRRVTLGETRSKLLAEDCPGPTRDGVWSLAIRRARTGRAEWILACAGLALPALAGTARTLGAWYRGDRADLHAAILVGFLQALATVDPGRKALSERLRWAAYRAGHAAVTESLQASIAIAPTESGDVVEVFWSRFRSAIPRPPWGHPDIVLARAIADGVLTRVEADLIGRTRLEGDSLASWAKAHGVCYSTANNARWRAERRLVDYLLHDIRDTDPDDELLPAATTAILLRAAERRPDSGPRESRAVSGRARNGREARTQKSSLSVRDSGRESGLLRCRGSAPTGRPSKPEGPDTEDRRCA